jgi:hypothetical protein
VNPPLQQDTVMQQQFSPAQQYHGTEPDADFVALFRIEKTYIHKKVTIDNLTLK